MPRKKSSKSFDYDIGYCKPPRQHQFVPGQSGFKGRKHKKSVPHHVLLENAINEVVEVNGVKMTKLELAIKQTFNQTIKAGKQRDLKLLFDMLRENGVTVHADLIAEAEAAAEEAMQAIDKAVTRMLDINPADKAAEERLNVEEAKLVMACPDCSNKLRKAWKTPSYVALNKRGIFSWLHNKILHRDQDERSIRSMEKLAKESGV